MIPKVWYARKFDFKNRLQIKIMNDDQTLLQLAAKARGISGDWDGTGIRINPHRLIWNPLNSPSDAMDLAVWLKMDLDCELGCARVKTQWFDGDFLGEDAPVMLRLCRAITCAAALVGHKL